jgi:hypothetical protein
MLCAGSDAVKLFPVTVIAVCAATLALDVVWYGVREVMV